MASEETFQNLTTQRMLQSDATIVRRLNISQTSLEPTFLIFTAGCEDGDLRLVGGDHENEGLLEVCLGQRWGTVNRDGWTDTDTQVACGQLGFTDTGNTS